MRHHLFPDLDRQPIIRFLLPGDLADLQESFVIDVKDRAAEQEAERDFSILECVKVLGCGDIEVERAWYGEVDDGAAGESRDDEGGMGPEHAPERLAPPVRLAEEVEEPFL